MEGFFYAQIPCDTLALRLINPLAQGGIAMTTRQGRPRTDRRTYNLQRRLGSLKRQQYHYSRMVGSTEARLAQLKQRLEASNVLIEETERELQASGNRG